MQSVAPSHWLELDRPDAARTVHVVVRLKSEAAPEAKRQALELAQALRTALEPIAATVQSRLAKEGAPAMLAIIEAFKEAVKAVPSSGLETVAEPLPPVSADGRVVGWRRNIYSYPPIGGPDGGAHVTIGDLLRFHRAVTEGRLLGPEHGQGHVQGHRLRAPRQQRDLLPVGRLHGRGGAWLQVPDGLDDGPLGFGEFNLGAWHRAAFCGDDFLSVVYICRGVQALSLRV